ncbi:MAG: hypothetical protein N4A47_03750 [Clostridia bacterium]|nr:hypothetical protein [Clostridia bacterium]
MKNLNVMRTAALAALITVGISGGAHASEVNSVEMTNLNLATECVEIDGDDIATCGFINLTEAEEKELEKLYKLIDSEKDEKKTEDLYKKVDRLLGVDGENYMIEPVIKLPKELEDMLKKIEKLEEEGKTKDAEKLWAEFSVKEFEYMHKDDLAKVSKEKKKEVMDLYKSIMNEKDMKKFEEAYNKIYKLLGYNEPLEFDYEDGDMDFIEIDNIEDLDYSDFVDESMPKEAKDLMIKIEKLEKEGKFEETDELWIKYENILFEDEIKDLSDTKKKEARKLNDEVNKMKEKDSFNEKDMEALDKVFEKLYKLIDENVSK